MVDLIHTLPMFTVELSYNEVSYTLDTHTMQIPQRHTDICTYTHTEISTHTNTHTHVTVAGVSINNNFERHTKFRCTGSRSNGIS